MAVGMARMTDVAQALIDSRLDTIDRILMGRMTRADRLAIVREVESQIHELLGERDPESLEREDVLEVLGRIDPPEAYLPDEMGSEPAPVPRGASVPMRPRASARRSHVGRLGGILGLSALGIVFVMPVAYLVTGLMESLPLMMIAVFGLGLLGLAGGVAGFVLGIRGRHEGAWPIVGIVAGSVAAAFCGFGMLGLLLLFLLE